jgi:hypothetical protein
VRLQDLFLILSQCVDLGLLSITAAFRGASDLKEILGSGFEMVRISQCESPRVFRIYDKEEAIWRSNLGSQYRSHFGIIQKLLVMGFETNRGERRFSMHAERSGRLEIIATCIAVTMPL